jgi:hypothetical protein
MVLCEYIAILAILDLSIIRGTIAVQSADGKPHNIPSYVSDTGGKLPHFNAVALFISGFPFNS